MTNVIDINPEMPDIRQKLGRLLNDPDAALREMAVEWREMAKRIRADAGRDADLLDLARDLEAVAEKMEKGCP